MNKYALTSDENLPKTVKGIVAEDHDVDDNHSEFQHLHGVSVIHDPSLTSCGNSVYTF